MDTIGKILFRPEVGPDVGTRHALHCLAIGKAWARMGGKMDFASSEMLPATIRRRILQSGFGFHALSQSRNRIVQLTEVNRILSATRPTWLVLAGDQYEENFCAGLQLENTRLMCRSDHECQAYRRNQYSKKRHLRSVARELDAEMISGSKYAIVHSEAVATAADKRAPAQARRILVAIDGLDSVGLACKALEAVETLNVSNLSIDILVDCCNQSIEQIQQMAADCSYSIRLHYNADRLSVLLRRMDLAIATAGPNCLEIAYHGVPILLFRNNPKQNELTESLVRANAAIEAVPDAGFAKQFRSLARNRDLRVQLSQGGQILVDSKGADRVARWMAAQAFRIRPATIKDASLMHFWRNDPEARATCFRQDCVPFDSHFDRLSSEIRSPCFELNIVSDQNSSDIGQFSLEFDCDFKQAELNINIVPGLRGRGLGTALIEMACRMAKRNRPALQIVANISSFSPVSQSAFRKAGFAPVSPTTINGQVGFQYQLTDNEPVSAIDQTVLPHTQELRKAS